MKPLPSRGRPVERVEACSRGSRRRGPELRSRARPTGRRSCPTGSASRRRARWHGGPGRAPAPASAPTSWHTREKLRGAPRVAVRGRVEQTGRSKVERKVGSTMLSRVNASKIAGPSCPCGGRPLRGPRRSIAAADVAEDARARRGTRRGRDRLAFVRHDRVEHELRHVRRMRERVPLADIGAVGDAVDDRLVDAERVSQRSRSATTSSVPKNRRRSPSSRAQARPPRRAAERGPSTPWRAASPGSRAHRRRCPAGRTSTIR